MTNPDTSREAAKMQAMQAMQDAHAYGIGFLRIDAAGGMTRIDPHNVVVDQPKEDKDDDQ